MKRLAAVTLTAVSLSGCVSPPPPATVLKNLYEIESAARRMEAQRDVGLVYVISKENDQGIPAGLRINGEASLDGTLRKKFYIYCLPPGGYNFEFVGGFPIRNKNEFLNVEAGRIYVREFDQGIVGLPPFFIFWGSNLKDAEASGAKDRIAISHIGEDATYFNSRFRCRSLLANVNAAAPN